MDVGRVSDLSEGWGGLLYELVAREGTWSFETGGWDLVVEAAGERGAKG